MKTQENDQVFLSLLLSILLFYEFVMYYISLFFNFHVFIIL